MGLRRVGFGAWAIALFPLGCGSEPSRLSGAPAPARDYWDEIAPRCAGFPSKNGCDDGDMALFGGLLCAAGDERGCALVRSAQGADGEWWRSPRRNPGNLGQSPSFSRDMAMGVLLYLAATRDTSAASRWLDWIDANRPCLVEKPFGGGCLIRGPHRFCRDEAHQSCTLEPGNWALLGRVWEALGLERTAEMRAAAGTDDDALWLEARTAEAGYPMHLAGVEVFLRLRLGETAGLKGKAAGVLAQRQPDNPFFVFLNEGASAALLARLYALCPADGMRSGGTRDQWSWERATTGQPWDDSMAWDCLFLENVLLAR